MKRVSLLALLIVTMYASSSAQITKPLRLLPPAAADPSPGAQGTCYVNTVSHKLRCYDASWADAGGTGTVTTSGSPASGQLALFSSGTAIKGDAGATYAGAGSSLDLTAGHDLVAGNNLWAKGQKVCMNTACDRYLAAGAGAPESAVTASVGSIWLRTDGGTGTTEYRKESGTGNTGWVAAAGGATGASFGVWSAGVSTGVNNVNFVSTAFGAFLLNPTNSSASSAASFSATESFRQMLIPVALTFSNFCVNTSGAQPGNGTLIFTLRDNGADTALTFTVAAGAGAGVYCDSTHTALIAAQHLVSFSVVNNSPDAASAPAAQWAIAYR
jgi:hypothetical protein